MSHPPYVFSSQAEKDRALDAATLLRLELAARRSGRFAGEDVVPDLEAELLLPEVRGDRSRLEVLLHPDFEEVGRSGRTFSREEMISALLEEEGADLIEMSDISVSSISPGTVLLRYVSVAGGARAERSSVWVFTAQSWRLRYHQGTPAA